MPLKLRRINYFLPLAMLLPGCTSTFFGTVLVLTFRDIITYIALAFFMAILVSLKSAGETRKVFWTWFILSLLLTPLAGFIYFLILFSRRTE